jgi:tetratricopeptide (TPR) repeat protein
MNFNSEIDKISTINISDEEFNKHNIPHTIRKSIVLYNESVLNLKMKSVDLAIANLKKSLSLNSDFSEAIKLLGLCYVYKKDFSKAEKLFKKLAKYDIHPVPSKEYLKEMKTDRTVSKALDAIQNASSNPYNSIRRDGGSKSREYSNKATKTKSSPQKFILSFVAASMVITIAVTAYYKHHYIQTEFNNIQSIFNKSPKVALEKNKKIEKQKTITQENKEIADKNKSLQKNLDATKAELDSQKDKNNIDSILSNAENLYANRNYEKALDDLITLQPLKLDDTEKSRFDKMWNGIATNGVWSIYNPADKLYKRGKYQEALPKLLKVQQVAPKFKIMPWVLYQIGTCYKQTNDNKDALLFFQKVKNDYPNTKYAWYADSIIKTIGVN